MNISYLSLTGKKKKVVDRWYPEILCSICKQKKYVKSQDLSKMITCPMCFGLGDIENRIKNRILIDDLTGCHEWTSYLSKDGYAKIKYEGKRFGVARLILEKKLNRRLKEGYETCHTCNNRKCVNPEHLYEGTHKQNGEDMARNGSLKGKGAKINSKIALQIKQMIIQGVSRKEIMERFNVSKYIVSNIKHGNSWNWV